MRRLLLAALGLAACGPVNPGGAGEGRTVVPDCSVSLDGAVSVAEMPLVPGTRALYVRNDPDAPVAALPGGGDVELDLTDGPEAVVLTVELLDPAGTEWGNAFPDADYASPLALQWPDLLGVYDWAGTGASGELRLLGVTTVDAEPAQRSHWVYDEPVVVLRLPLEPGDGWGQTATWSNGVAAGLPEAAVEDWSFTAVEAGRAELPGGIVVDEVVLVTSRVEQQLALSVGPSRSVRHGWQWFSPCFGEIAGAFGADPTGVDLDEYRRLIP